MEYSTEYTETRINIRDLIAYLFRKLLYIVILMLVFSILFAGIRLFQTETSTADRINNLREQFSEEELDEADGVISRYVFCLDYVFGRNDKLKLQRNMYLLDCGYYPTEIISSSIALNDEEFKSISDILGIESDGYRTLADQVTVETYTDKSFEDKKLFISVSVYSDSYEQCIKAMSVIEQSIDRVKKIYEEQLGSVEVKLVSSVYTSTESELLNSSREERLERLSKISSVLSGLTSSVGYLSDEQKEYINSVVKPLRNNLLESSRPNEKSLSSVLKYAVLGILFGLVLSVGFLVLIYLLDGSIKTTEDIEVLGNKDTVLDPIYYPNDRNTISRLISNKLRGVDKDQLTVSRAVALSRISHRIKEIKPQRIIFINDSESDLCVKVTDDLARNDIVGNMSTRISSFASFASFCLEIEEDDAVILILELGKTKKKVVDRWLDFCAKNGKRIAAVLSVDHNC